MKIFVAALISTLLWIGCTPQAKELRDPVQRELEEKAQGELRDAERQRQEAATCIPFSDPEAETPIYIDVDSGGFVVTRVLKSCVTRDGAHGFAQNSPWMAMGIPCSGGPGSIEVTGRSYAPKIISFNMSTDCTMNPSEPAVVQETTNAHLGLTPANKLLAYNPLSVQYWEVEGYRDAGVGDAVELRTVESIKTGWIDFKDNNKPLVVQLYGRENAWVQDAKIFHVKAELTFVRPHNFAVKVLEVEALNEADQKAAALRCQAIGLRSKCGEVFD